MNKLVMTAVAAALGTSVAFAAGDQGIYEDQKYSGPLHDQATDTLGDQEGVVESGVDDSMQQQSDLAGFETLDSDGDGVISREEAADHDVIVSNWEGIDADASDNIDRAEFSAFEESGFLDRDAYQLHNTGPLYNRANESEANPDVPGVPDIGR